jgi:hypothetical protein
MTLTDFGTLIIALGTIGSLLYISRQVNVARQQAKGQFLLALDAQFEKFNPITVRLVNEQAFTPNGKDWYEIWGLMSVFERINIMVEDKILDVGLVDRLHGFRLISIIANDGIFQRLKETSAEWKDFIDLCYAVADHRQKNTPDPADADFIKRVHTLNTHVRRVQNPFRFSN